MFKHQSSWSHNPLESLQHSPRPLLVGGGSLSPMTPPAPSFGLRVRGP